MSQRDLEIVVSRYNEDVSWVREYKSAAVVYNKGQPLCDIEVIALPNVGREGHTYLHHIVNHWDHLADWTVFTQGAQPQPRFTSACSQPIGHLYSNSYFKDFIEHRDTKHFVFSQSISFDLHFLRLRSGYRRYVDVARPIEQYPRNDGVDKWLHWGLFGRELEKIRSDQGGSDFSTFWHDFIQRPVPSKGIVYFAQGAQFGVSREVITRNSRDYYERLLRELSGRTHPYQGWFLEFCWYYMFSTPEELSHPQKDHGPLDNPRDRLIRLGSRLRRWLS